jgi:hypothetical protein
MTATSPWCPGTSAGSCLVRPCYDPRDLRALHAHAPRVSDYLKKKSEAEFVYFIADFALVLSLQKNRE